MIVECFKEQNYILVVFMIVFKNAFGKQYYVVFQINCKQLNFKRIILIDIFTSHVCDVFIPKSAFLLFHLFIIFIEKQLTFYFFHFYKIILAMVFVSTLYVVNKNKFTSKRY